MSTIDMIAFDTSSGEAATVSFSDEVSVTFSASVDGVIADPSIPGEWYSRETERDAYISRAAAALDLNFPGKRSELVPENVV